MGEIVQSRVILAGAKIPNYLRGYATHIPELGNSTSVIVEFQTNEQAKSARNNVINQFTEKNKELKVAILGPKIKRNLYKNTWVPRNKNGGKLGENDSSSSNSEEN